MLRAAMSQPVLPQRARVVVVGGGIIGCSVAYHLAHMGWKDVVLLERDRLTSGTTWHAAGLIVTFGSTSETSTEMRKYTRDLYARLEAETGLVDRLQARGVHRGGGRRGPPRGVPPRLGVQPLLRRRRARDLAARGARSSSRSPRTDDILAGFYVKEDGRANPVDVDDGARQGGADAGRDDPRGRARHRASSTKRGASPASRPPLRRHRGRVRRQLRRHVGAAARREGGRQHPAAVGRALLPHHRQDPRARRPRGPCSRTRARTATSARRSAG